MRISFDSEYEYGETVYYKTDPEQLPGIITAILYAGSDIRYEASFNKSLGLYQAVELSKEKNILLLTGIDEKKSV